MSDSRGTIQNRLLASVDDSYNKSEGEFIYDSLMPVAIELESAYVIIDGMLDKAFADTATGKNLDRIVNSVGLTRKITSKSYGVVAITGISGSIINKGELVASDSVNFEFTETSIVPLSGHIDVNVKCTSYGINGNVPIGAIKYFPKTLTGLQTVTNSEAFTNGYNEEDDDTLRERYYVKVRTPATSGNKYHYLNWALNVTGVGNANILPLWNGNGTVKVIIINSNKVGADPILVQKVAAYIEEQRPIGATVTVVSAEELALNITGIVTIDADNYTLATVVANIEVNITEYLKDIAFESNDVSYARVGSVILDTVGVKDYSYLRINGGIENINLTDSQVAVLGGVNLG